ncbi:hypothetical protein C6W84_2870 [Acinetobacter baumannii]|nr:hypothetical protein C6W84_2870 [Acinetobacter baumannii]
MDVVNNRRATFKKILNVTSGNFLEQYDFFFLVSMPPISQQSFSILIMNMSL